MMLFLGTKIKTLFIKIGAAISQFRAIMSLLQMSWLPERGSL